MNFRSDNEAPVAPEIMEALARANSGTDHSYGADAATARLQGQDPKSVVSGKSVDLGCRRIIKKKNTPSLQPVAANPMLSPPPPSTRPCARVTTARCPSTHSCERDAPT